MNEIALILVAIIILVAIQYAVIRIKKPASSYIKITAAVALLLFIWLLNTSGKMPAKLLITAVAAASLVKEFIALRKFKKEQT